MRPAILQPPVGAEGSSASPPGPMFSAAVDPMSVPSDPFADLNCPHLRLSMNDRVPSWLRRLRGLLDTPRHDGERPWTDAQLEAAMLAADQAHAKCLGPLRVRNPGEQIHDDTLADRCLAAAPSTLMRLALDAMTWRRSQGGAVPADAFDFTGMGPETGALALRLLAEASLLPAQAMQPWSLPGQDPRRTLRLHVLVLAGSAAAPKGAAVQVELRLARLTGARAALLPSPEQALTPITVLWARGLGRAQAWWHKLLQDCGADRLLHDVAVVWRVLPQPHALAGQLQGDSASAAIALGGLWLLSRDPSVLQHLQRDHRWAQPLQELRPLDFAELFLSAAMEEDSRADGLLREVGGVVQKDAALDLARSLAPRGSRLKLHTAGDAQALASGVETHLSLLNLARQLCRLNEPDTGEQKLLTAQLVAALQDSAEAAGPQAAVQPPDQPLPSHAPPRLHLSSDGMPAALRRLADPDQPSRPDVHTLAHFALHRWAVHGRPWGSEPVGSEGQVHHRFVNLQLKRHAEIAQPFDSLEQLLVNADVADKDAVLIVGEPGAGKSWLLMRHEQALCEQIIAAHGNLVPWPDGTQPAHRPVLPLYLSLRDLPADAEPVDWFRSQLRARFPAMRPSLDLLFEDGWHPWQLQLMLDGLNEVKVLADSSAELDSRRSDRVNQVVLSLRRALPRDLLLVLGSRPGHAWTLKDAKGGLRFVQASVERWTREQIKTYVEQRWAAKPELAAAFIQQVPDAVQRDGTGGEAPLLQGLPLFLNMQCELWEAGARHLARKPGQLLASMLWLRLLAAHERDSALKQHTAFPGMVCERTELPHARRFRAALQVKDSAAQAVPPPFPNKGLLMRGLLALAKRQWLHHAHDGQESNVRGQVAVPPKLVREVLRAELSKGELKGKTTAQRTAATEDLVKRWLAAVQDLGIGQYQGTPQAGAPGGTFAFSHQVIGEWLASLALFHTGVDPRKLGPDEEPQPRHWYPHKLKQLRQELSPPPLARDAAAELQFQREQAAAAWELVPQALIDRWLADGISLTEAEAARDLAWARDQVGERGLNLLDWYQHPEIKYLSVCSDADGTRWTWHLDAFARRLESFGVLPAAGQAWLFRRDCLAFVCAHSELLLAFSDRMQADVAHALGNSEDARRRAASLWQKQGRLQLPPPGPLDDILPLALDGLADAQPWWTWLAQVAQPLPDGAEPAAAEICSAAGTVPMAPWAVLSRCLTTIQPEEAPARITRATRPARQAAPATAGAWALSARHLLQVVFDIAGHDLRQRIQAGLLLGRQGGLGTPRGDHLRYERVAQGVRLRRHDLLRGLPQWLPCGGEGVGYRLSQGSATGPLGPLRHFPLFEVAAYPVTVGEFMAFLAYPHALDAQADWWQTAGAEASAWLRCQGDTPWQPVALRSDGYDNPLQPIAPVPAYVADAYSHWAQQVLYADAPGFVGDGLAVGLLDEWQLEAAVRGPWQPEAVRDDADLGAFWPGHASGPEPDPMLFNHVATGWGVPSPVGCFGGSTTADGLADGAGNVWSWCANTIEHQGQRLRALRGGSCASPAVRCAAGVRHSFPSGNDSFYYISGFRLGRVRAV